MPEPAVLLEGVTKRFPGVVANDGVDLRVEAGEIHALCGENGAGKSTLMNVIYGLYRQDEGEIIINGQEVEINNPHDAIHKGIGMVHQHFMLVPVFTVAENMILGHEVTKGPSRCSPRRRSRTSSGSCASLLIAGFPSFLSRTN